MIYIYRILSEISIRIIGFVQVAGRKNLIWNIGEFRVVEWKIYVSGRSRKMPYITVESGALTDEQKEELIKRLTEVSSEVMKVPQEFFVTTIK